ncbi:MAG TPA: hypothetical protein VKD90_23425 [Gemmataceae bacterium]|nr:hypothetical protein [Gemmataceae bacterium]
MPTVRRPSPVRLVAAACAVVVSVGALPGCGPPEAPPEPEAKVRLQKVLRLYQVYVERNKKGPPDAQALKAFGQKLTPQERDEYLIGDDLESIWVSPRDNQPYEVRYNLRLDPAQNRAVAWEAVGKDGNRYVALSTGYVEEYDDATFREYKQ